MVKLNLLTEVQDELSAAYQWYEQQAIGLGDDYLAELESSFEIIVSL